MQYLHLPPSIAKLNTGTRSYHFITFPQFMQWERVVVMFSFFGILYMQTFKKLPIQIPKIKNTNKQPSISNNYYLKIVAISVESDVFTYDVFDHPVEAE